MTVKRVYKFHIHDTPTKQNTIVSYHNELHAWVLSIQGTGGFILILEVAGVHGSRICRAVR